MRWQRTGLLALGLLLGCGKSASQRHPTVDASGGADDDAPHAAGAGATSSNAGASAQGGTGTSAGAGVGGSTPPSLGGEAGAAASPPLMLPPGCQPRAPEETAATCSLAVDCDASPSLRTYCYRTDAGAWECQCANHADTYRVQHVAGLEACALAATLCSDDALELGEESCERTRETSEDDSCIVDVTCGKRIELDDTHAEAWLLRQASAHCNRWGSNEVFFCSCMNGAPTDYSLLANGGDTACGPFADFCMSGETPVFDGEEQCVLNYRSSDAEGCQRADDCGPRMALGDNVSLSDLETRHTNCVPSPTGGSDCSCSGPDSAFFFQLSTPPNDASCEAAVPNCDPNTLKEPIGPASCEPIGSNTSGDDMCSALLSCTQDAEIDGRSIVAKGTLAITCRRAATGMPWQCGCGVGPDTTKFELGLPGATATQACGQATAGCLERLDLPLGPISDPISAPDPFF